METKLTRLIYDRSPFALRNLFASIYGWRKNRLRFTGDYRRWARFFEEAHGWSQAELRNYQDERLHAMAREAYEHVPYWNETFKSLGLTPDDLRTVDDLPKLPPLEKRTVAEQGTRMLDDRVNPKEVHWHETSGSTGTPLRIPSHPKILQMEWAFIWTRYRHGMTLGDPWGSFAGLEIVPPGRTRPPFWIDNWASHQRMFSIFHMNERTLPHYVRALDERYNKFLTGYSSAAWTIADYMLRNDIKLDRPPEAFFAASEELQPKAAEALARAFECKVWNRYGQHELTGSITEYPCGHLHVDMDFSIVELEPAGAEDDGTLTEMLQTNFHDTTWPLFRYRIGDLAVVGDDDVCPGGTPGRVVRRLHGRTGHYFVLPDGSRVTNISVIAKKCHHIRYMQVVQDTPGELTVRIVRDDRYTEADEANVIEQFRRKVGPDLALHLDYVEEIERSSTGKYLSIVNRLS